MCSRCLLPEQILTERFLRLALFWFGREVVVVIIQTRDFQDEVSVLFSGRSRSNIDGFYHFHVKRALDIFLVLLMAPIVIPVVLAMAAMVAFGGGKPFYSQMRVGHSGRAFRIWKVRTMTVNADEVLEQHLSEDPAAREEWDTTQKLKNDPRITRIGHVFRKTSLDELPQLWNVLCGSMSLVGPRPMMVSQKSQYPGAAYYLMRPGISGLWQVSDRNSCDFADRALYDDTYARTVSLRTDVSILAKTVLVVIKATGY